MFQMCFCWICIYWSRLIVASCCRAGSARLSLTVRKAKMEYRGAMEKPCFTLSIRARGGTPLELSQDTAPGVFANGVLLLDHTLVLSTPIQQIPQGKLVPPYKGCNACGQTACKSMA